MSLTLAPAGIVAAPNPKDPATNRSTGRLPVRQAPIPEPAPLPGVADTGKGVRGAVINNGPISLPQLPEASGRISTAIKTGSTLSVRA
jgi:hypothetical protein